MSSVERKLAEARSLSVLLHRASERAQRDFAAAVEPLGVTAPMARTVLLLATPTPMRGIAEHLACDPSYVTNVADLLERAGLAERVTGTDRRVKLLALTPAGLRLRGRIAEKVAREATVLRTLTPAQREALRELAELMLR